MPTFTYECISKSGEIIKGRVEAQEEEAAVMQLRKMGYSVLDLKRDRESSINSILDWGKKVKISELALFSRQLSAMIGAGIPLTRAIHTLGRQADNSLLKNALQQIASNVEGGMNFTEALSSYPKIFSPLYISMIHAGEVGGDLEMALTHLSDQLQRDKALKDSIKSATFYPKMVAGFAGMILVAMLVFIVPIFMGFFPEDRKLPLPTEIIMVMSNSLRSRWYIWICAAVAVVLLFTYYIKSPMGKNTWDRVKFKLPAFGPLIHKSVMARFSRTLATLLEGGIPVVQALESAGPTSGSFLVEKAVKNASLRIQEGKSISGELEESGIFPPMVIQMIAVGEETGSLPSLLSKIAEFYEDEVAAMSKGLTALIEPLMLVIVGSVIGLMLIAMYLPMFTAVTEVGR